MGLPRVVPERSDAARADGLAGRGRRSKIVQQFFERNVGLLQNGLQRLRLDDAVHRHTGMKRAFWVMAMRIGLSDEPKPSRFKADIPTQRDPNEDVSKLKPNPLTLVVSISPDLQIKLNQDAMGSVNDPSELSAKLQQTFQQRKEQHAYKVGMEAATNIPEDQRIEKTVFVKAPRALHYGDVVKVIDAIKGAGANPVGLQVDDLP